jgi:hypothetical protein
MEVFMKSRSYFIFFFLLAIYFTGCIPSKYIAENDQEKIFQHDLDLSKPKIKERLITFVNEKFTSSKAVMQNNEDGLFSGNGIGQVTTYIGKSINMEFTFIVKYTDNNYKVKWVIKDIMMDTTPLLKEQWGFYVNSEEINTFLRRMIMTCLLI